MGLPTNRLAELRTAAGLSRPALASRLGLKSDRTVYRWESGESQIPDETKLELAAMFEVSPAHLMGWDGAERAA